MLNTSRRNNISLFTSIDLASEIRNKKRARNRPQMMMRSTDHNSTYHTIDDQDNNRAGTQLSNQCNNSILNDYNNFVTTNRMTVSPPPIRKTVAIEKT